MFTILLPDEPKGELPKDDNAKITGKMVSADLLPESTMQIVTEALERISELATALIPVSKNLNLLLEQRPTAQVDSASSQPTQPSDGLPPNVSTAVQRLDMTLKNFNDVIGDPTVKDNLRDFINNLAVAGADLKQIVADLKPLPAQARTFVETGNRMLENLDKTVGNVDIRVNEFAKAGKGIAGQLESVLENVNQITQTIADGKGTAGRLVKDEKLYEALLNTVEQLKETIKEFKVLITKLQAEGLRLL
jgi:ABC-type transporter Mla subunit MlaD